MHTDPISHSDNDKLKAAQLLLQIAEDGVSSDFSVVILVGLAEHFTAFSAADKTYGLRWLIKYGSNPRPPESFTMDAPGDLGLSVTDRNAVMKFVDSDLKTKYKLLNHYQVKFLTTPDGKFETGSVKDIIKLSSVGSTKDAARVYDVWGPIDSIGIRLKSWIKNLPYPYGGAFPGQAGPHDKAVTANDTETKYSHEGKPDATGVAALGALGGGGPATFVIWSTITFYSNIIHYHKTISPTTGNPLTRNPEPTTNFDGRVNTQMYPTYWIYLHGVKLGVQNQDPDPAALLYNTDQAQ